MKKPIIFVGSRKSMNRLFIVADLAGYEIIGILDHHYYGNTDNINGVPVIGDERWLLDSTNSQAQEWLDKCFFFPGNFWSGNQPSNPKSNQQLLRLDRIRILEKCGAKIVSLIHPNSYPLYIDNKYAAVKLGKGVFIDNNCWIGTNNVEIGDYSTIMEASKIATDSTLGKNVTVAPNSFIFHCVTGDNCYFGFSSKSYNYKTKIDRDRLIIGNDVLVWTNAEVMKDIPSHSIYTDTHKILKKLNPLSEELLTIGEYIGNTNN